MKNIWKKIGTTLEKKKFVNFFNSVRKLRGKRNRKPNDKKEIMRKVLIKFKPCSIVSTILVVPVSNDNTKVVFLMKKLLSDKQNRIEKVLAKTNCLCLGFGTEL